MSFASKLMFWKHDNLDIPKFNASPNYDGYSPDKTGFDKRFNSMDRSLGLNKDPLQMNDPLAYPKTGLEDLNQSEDFGSVMEQPSLNTQSNSFTKFRQSGLGQMQQQPSEDMSLSKNIEILTAKVETIKSMLDFLSHKIDKIEKIAEGEQQKPVSKRYQL